MTSAFVQELLQSKEVFTADPARVLQGLVPIDHHLGLGSRLVQTHCLGLFQVLSLACLGLGLGLGLGLSQILGLGLESMAFWSSSEKARSAWERWTSSATTKVFSCRRGGRLLDGLT